jgi:predicted ATP-grasp superfamily ATP-dependent carboligase
MVRSRYDGSVQPLRHPPTRRGPVLVLDPIGRHAVAAVRGLGRAGWEVVVAGSESQADALAASSRYAAGRYERLPDPHGEAAPFEAALAEVVHSRGCQAIVAVSDSTIARLRHLDVDVPTLPRMDAALDRVIDKVSLAAVCADAHITYPPTWSPGLAVPAAAGWPRIVKPRQTAIVRPGRVVGRTGAFVVADPAQEAAAVAVLRAAELEPIVQVRVGRAHKVSVAIVRHRGRTSFRIAYQVLLEYPPQGGQAAAIVSIDPHRGIGALALEVAERVCDAAGYEGLANVQLYGQDDGSICLIEVNPRVWGSAWFAERLGLRPVERAVLAALDEDPLPPLDYPLGRRFHRPTLEARWLLAPRCERDGAWRLPAIIRPWDVFDLLSVTDPLPFVAGLRRMVIRSGEELVLRSNRQRRR